MPLEGCIAYAAFANLALGKTKHRNAIRDRWPVHARRILGTALLLLSYAAATWRFGAIQGPVMWLGMLSLAGIVLVLLLSRWPAVALRLWAPLGLGAALLFFV